MEQNRGAGAAGDPAALAGAAAGAAGADGLNRGAFPGGEGYPGASGSGGNFKEGSAEAVVDKFAAAVQADDYESAASYVAEKATGMLKTVRDGSISDNQKQQLKAYVTGLKYISTRPQGRTLTANFNGGSNKVLAFKLEKVEEEFVISGLTIRDAPRARR